MSTQKIDAQSVAQTQGKVLPKLTPSADFSLKTKFALANALANSTCTPEEGEAALKKSIGQALAKPAKATKAQQYVEGWKEDFKGVSNPMQLANAVVNRTRKGFGSIDSMTGLPQGTTEKAWAVGAAFTGGLYAKAALSAGTAATTGALSGNQAVGTVASLVGASALASCDSALPGEEHNHFETIPVDTVNNDIYHEVIVEKPVPGPVIRDTTFIRDTIQGPGIRDTVFKTDTFIKEIQLPPITLPGETIRVKEGFKSEVPEKIKEVLHDLGVDTTGVGQFVYGIDYQDEKNSTVHRMLWDGGRTSRDGDVYVMNDIGTVWSDPAEAYVFGQNEQFFKHDLYLNGNRDLSDSPKTPVSPINVSNGNNQPNWFIFDRTQPTAEPGNWTTNNPKSFSKVGDGEWQSSEGFTYKRGSKPGEIVKYNTPGAEWKLRNVSIIGGEDTHAPQ